MTVSYFSAEELFQAWTTLGITPDTPLDVAEEKREKRKAANAKNSNAIAKIDTAFEIHAAYKNDFKGEHKKAADQAKRKWNEQNDVGPTTRQNASGVTNIYYGGKAVAQEGAGIAGTLWKGLKWTLKATAAVGIVAAVIYVWNGNRNAKDTAESSLGVITKAAKVASTAVGVLDKLTGGAAPATQESSTSEQFIKCGYALAIPGSAAEGGPIPMHKGDSIQNATPFKNVEGKDMFRGTVVKGDKTIWVAIEKADVLGQACRPDPQGLPQKMPPRLVR